MEKFSIVCVIQIKKYSHNRGEGSPNSRKSPNLMVMNPVEFSISEIRPPEEFMFFLKIFTPG